MGRVDVWINNVGRGITRRRPRLTDEDIDEVMQVNVKSALYGMQAMLPHSKARGTGHVINISPSWVRMPLRRCARRIAALSISQASPPRSGPTSRRPP
jgi:NADP-dependent 3-hydroxy acid dehydrogenase YdfG